MPCTPAMASGLTDHIWSIFELLSYKVVPPPLPVPKRRGRSAHQPFPEPRKQERPRIRLRKGVLSSTTV
jgi:hypothetical protein